MTAWKPSSYLSSSQSRRVTPPFKLLKGFQKVFSAKGDSVSPDFELTVNMFRYTGLDGKPLATIDEGPVKVLIGDKELELQLQA